MPQLGALSHNSVSESCDRAKIFIYLCDEFSYAISFEAFHIIITSIRICSLLLIRSDDNTLGTGTGQAIGKDLSTVRNSNFDASLPTRIVIHGWFGGSWNWFIGDMRKEMLKYVGACYIYIYGII